MIDPTLVVRNITLIGQDLRELEALSRKRLEEYLGSRYDEVLAERFPERLIGRMIDINYHLITEADHPPPKDYDEPFIHLGRLNLLPPDLAHRIAAWAGLRKRIVHEYDDIDPARVYEGAPGGRARRPAVSGRHSASHRGAPRPIAHRPQFQEVRYVVPDSDGEFSETGSPKIVKLLYGTL